MSNDELPDPDEGWRLLAYGRGVPIRVGRRLLGGVLDNRNADWAPQFATVQVPGCGLLALYVRREFVRDPEISNLPYKQVAVFWCCPNTSDDELERLAAERWP